MDTKSYTKRQTLERELLGARRDLDNLRAEIAAADRRLAQFRAREIAAEQAINRQWQELLALADRGSTS